MGLGEGGGRREEGEVGIKEEQGGKELGEEEEERVKDLRVTKDLLR